MYSSLANDLDVLRDVRCNTPGGTFLRDMCKEANDERRLKDANFEEIVSRTSLSDYSRHKPFDSLHAELTKKWPVVHRPLIVAYYEIARPFSVLQVTLALMQRYGINKVRGGRYRNVDLSKEQLYNLEFELASEKIEFGFPSQREDADGDSTNRKESFGRRRPIRCELCARCDRRGHSESSCYSRRHLKGHWLAIKATTTNEKI